MAWTSEDEKLLAELAGEVTTERSGSERSEVPRFGSKTSSNSATSRRSSLKSLDSVTSLLEKLDRPHGERGKAQRKTSKEVEALPEVSGLKEGLQTEASEASLRSRQVVQALPATTKPDHDKEEEAQRELAAERASSEKAQQELSRLREELQTEASLASLRSRQVEQHNATREQVLPATTKPDHDKEEEAQRELAAERASSEKAQQELSRLREELQTEASEASLRSRQVEQLQQEVSCLQEELQTAETSLHRQEAELMAASREQVLLATPKSEDSKEEAPKSLWARFRRDVSPTRVKDSQKAQRELGRLKEQLRTAEAELQEASKREQAQQELNRLTVELQTTEAGLYKAALKREQDAQRELSAERVAFQEARQELSRLREQLQIAEEQLRQEPTVPATLDRRDEDAQRELAAEYETFQQAQQELFHLGAELQRAEAGLWHQRAELEEEMQKMQSDRPAKQLQTSPSNKQKLHGQHEELRQLRLLQEEVRKQEEVAKSQEAQRSFWQERSEEQDREIEKFRSELQSLKAEKARSRNGANDGAVGLEEQLESERKRESVEQVNIQSFEDQRSQQFAEKDGDEDIESKEFSTMACLSRFKGQLAAKGVSDLDALTKIFAAYDTQKEQESITQIGFVCAMQQGGFLLSKSEVDGMFTHLAGELHGQLWRLPYEYLQSCMDDVSCPLPEVQWATGLIRSADEAARLQGKSLEMLFGQLEMESVSQLDVQAILSRYVKVGSGEWMKLLPLMDKNPDGTVPWKSMLTWAGLGRQPASPCPEASAPPSDAADREAVQSGEVLAMQITIRELRGELEAQERCMEELQELQQQIQGMSAAEAHQELRMHSRLAQFEMNQLQEMQEVKHHLHEELAERERQNRVDLARHAELQKDSKSREETLESTAAELEKELKFWQRRSDEDLEELLQLQSEMKSLKDAEALAAADWEKTLHMNLRQQQMEAHEDLRQVRDELQKAIEALQREQEKSEEKQKAGERELLALRSSFQQEMTRAETELQVSFVQERGRLDALLNAESDCAQQLEASRLREKYLEEELRGKCELCTEAADALRENLMELEKQVELNEERREGEAQLASRVEQLEKQRREWKKTTKALENQEQEMVALREDLRRSAEQHQTSPVNKRTLRVQLEQLQEQFQKELAEKGEEHERALEAAKEAEEKLEEMRLKQLQLEEQLEEQHAEQLSAGNEQRAEVMEQQERSATLEAELKKMRRKVQTNTKVIESQEQEMVALREDLRRAAEQHQTSLVNKRTLRVQLEQLQEQFQKELAEKGEEHERELEAAKEAEEKLEEMRLKQLQLEEQLEEQHAEQLIDLEQRSAHQRSEEQELLELRSELESLRDAQAGATFISVNADQAQEAIEMLTHELHSAQDSLLRERRQHATMWASGKQQDFGEEVLAARALVQEELQCYNSSRIAQQAKFEAELAEKDKQHQKDCEELKEVHKSELQATKQEEKLRPETEEMTRVRDELRQLEEQRVAQEEARQEEEQNNQRLAAEFQQQLSEWQQRSERQTAELEEYLTEMESCRRSEEQNISKLEEFQREMDSCQREAVDCQRRIEDLERHEEDEVKVREEAQREQREQISAELRLAALLRTELEDQRSDWQQKSDEQSKELVELQSEMQSFKAAKEAVTACCEQLVKESQQELEDRCRVERRAREDWRNQRCSLLGQLRQSSEEKHLLEKKLACSERDLWEASEHVRSLWEHRLKLQEECQVQNQMLNGGLRRTLEEQQEEALALHHAVQAKERELLEMKLHRQEFSGEEEHLKVQLQQSEMRCKMQREEAEEWKEESRRFEKELLHQRSSFVQGGQELQQGQPWMKGVMENRALFLSVLTVAGSVAAAAWEFQPQLNELIHLSPFPNDEFRWKVMALVELTLLGTFLWDRLCVLFFAPEIFKAMVDSAKKTTFKDDVVPVFVTVGKVLGVFVILGTGNILMAGLAYWMYRRHSKDPDE